MSSSRRFQISAFVILLFHIVGVIGMNVMQRDYAMLFERVAWANIMLSFSLLIWCHEGGRYGRLGVFMLSTYVVGMAVEIMGVRTGAIFGVYHYTERFGWAIWSVPLIIGLNWALLSYAIGATVSALISVLWLRVVLAALMMSASDVLLENFAIKHSFWVWGSSGDGHSAAAPIQNFVAWFVISLLMQTVYQYLIPQSRNKLALCYMIVFVLFLIVDKML